MSVSGFHEVLSVPVLQRHKLDVDEQIVGKSCGLQGLADCLYFASTSARQTFFTIFHTFTIAVVAIRHTVVLL